MKISENPVNKRVYCGDCGCFLRSSDNYYRENGRQLLAYCCQTRKSRENYVTTPEICVAVKAQLLAERQAAIDAKCRIEAFISSGEYKQMEERYLDCIHFWMNVIHENCTKINSLYKRQEKPVHLPKDLQPKYDALCASSQKAAENAAALEAELYRFHKGFSLENKWLRLYSSLPEELDITPEITRTYVPRIFLFHNKHVTIKPNAEDAKKELLWCLSLPDAQDSAYVTIHREQHRKEDSKNA
ncbi:MAG: hypothetical protein LUD14_05080 [Clostridiales bacterium]|nr:hypothetical protein [Clostridiales bacterium]